MLLRLPGLGGSVICGQGSPKGAFFNPRLMSKITGYYLNKASYFAVDDQGQRVEVEIDYWQGKYKVSRKHRGLEKYAQKLVEKKHRVNFLYKLEEAGVL